jgi:hypothetical protein
MSALDGSEWLVLPPGPLSFLILIGYETRYILVDNIKMDLKKVYANVDWINLDQGSSRWLGLASDFFGKSRIKANSYDGRSWNLLTDWSPNRLVKRQASRLISGRCLIRISAEMRAIMRFIVVFLSHQTFSGTVPGINHDHLLPNSNQFIIHKSFHHPLLHNFDTESAVK